MGLHRRRNCCSDALSAIINEFVYNRTMANKKNRQESLPNRYSETFTVGAGAHTGFNGDAYPYTVVAVSDSGRKVWVSRDLYKIVDDQGAYVEGHRKCEFTTVERPLEECECFTLRKNGYFTRRSGESGAWALSPGRAYAQNPSV